MLKKKWAAVAFVGVLGSWTLLAAAGAKYQMGVGVGSNYAYGSLGDARASSDTNQSIGCQSYGTYAWCSATDSAGNSKACFTDRASDIAAIHSIGQHSYVYFSFTSDRNCSFVSVSNQSVYLPMTP
jgi:hypothetical protein